MEQVKRLKKRIDDEMDKEIGSSSESERSEDEEASDKENDAQSEKSDDKENKDDNKTQIDDENRDRDKENADKEKPLNENILQALGEDPIEEEAAEIKLHSSISKRWKH
ncbi:tripartite motif-containing protein 44-like [Prorops nasuta]|uniref:tripartite motif-containing protein 44-like n=1 Tax=Prorops nasuta TaxID=863751 RepID=UPI0034CF6180